MENFILEDAYTDDLDDIVQDLLSSHEGGIDLTKVHGASRPGKAANLDLQHDEGHKRLFLDYFNENPVYDDTIFAPRFRVARVIFLKLVRLACKVDNYFVQKKLCSYSEL